MKQPIFGIKKSKVKEIITHQSHFTVIPSYYDWGEIKSLDQLLNGIDIIKDLDGYVKMSDLHLCFQNFETHNMVREANRMIKRVLALCKEYREDLNEICRAQILLDKWKPILDYTNTSNDDKKLATAMLIESQEQWMMSPKQYELSKKLDELMKKNLNEASKNCTIKIVKEEKTLEIE
jgi:hypothetical protein